MATKYYEKEKCNLYISRANYLNFENKIISIGKKYGYKASTMLKSLQYLIQSDEKIDSIRYGDPVLSISLSSHVTSKRLAMHKTEEALSRIESLKDVITDKMGSIPYKDTSKKWHVKYSEKRSRKKGEFRY